MRHIVIGDVHGCLVEMVELLARLIPGSSDNVYFLGDLVDRGPHSAECIKLIIELQKSSQAGYHCVLGNHDEKYIRWFKHELNRELTGKANPMEFGEDKLATVEMLTSEDIAWLSKLPKTRIQHY